MRYREEHACADTYQARETRVVGHHAHERPDVAIRHRMAFERGRETLRFGIALHGERKERVAQLIVPQRTGLLSEAPSASENQASEISLGEIENRRSASCRLPNAYSGSPISLSPRPPERSFASR